MEAPVDAEQPEMKEPSDSEPAAAREENASKETYTVPENVVNGDTCSESIAVDENNNKTCEEKVLVETKTSDSVNASNVDVHQVLETLSAVLLQLFSLWYVILSAKCRTVYALMRTMFLEAWNLKQAPTPPREPVVTARKEINTEEIWLEVVHALPNLIEDESSSTQKCSVSIDYPDDVKSWCNSVGGFSWETTFEQSGERLKATVSCNKNSLSLLWGVMAKISMTIESKTKVVAAIEQQIENDFSIKNKTANIDLGKWSVITSTENMYADGDEVVVIVKIEIVKDRGANRPQRFDFLTHQPGATDVVLQIDGVSLYVNKHYLSWYSTYFDALFFRNFAERNKCVIEIKDIDCQQFIELLHVIYPGHKRVDEQNVDYLLHLGNFFHIQYVLNICEYFLIKESQFPTGRLLYLSDRYSLISLQEHVLTKLNTQSSIKNLITCEYYKKLGDTALAALHLRSISF